MFVFSVGVGCSVFADAAAGLIDCTGAVPAIASRSISNVTNRTIKMEKIPIRLLAFFSGSRGIPFEFAMRNIWSDGT